MYTLKPLQSRLVNKYKTAEFCKQTLHNTEIRYKCIHSMQQAVSRYKYSA